MYVAVKGGERAIENAHAWLAEERRGDRAVPALGLDQIAEQLSLAVARVMAEGSLHDPELAALAIKQARGDLIEAVFLIRAYRTTLPRLGAAIPLDTAVMLPERRVSATFKDAPGGQVLGPTFDYTHRLLDFALAAEGAPPEAPSEAPRGPAPRILGFLEREGLMEPPPEGGEPGDITRAPMEHPAPRDVRLQALARADEGFVLSLAYSTQRGHGRNHAFVGELRIGAVEVELDVPGVGPVSVGEVVVTECETVNQFGDAGPASDGDGPRFTRGYGLVLGRCERKAIAMALVDRAMRAGELGEEAGHPAQDAEFVLSHCDNVQATGFLEHIKLPHYVDFQAELELLRRLRADLAREQHSREAAE